MLHCLSYMYYFLHTSINNLKQRFKSTSFPERVKADLYKIRNDLTIENLFKYKDSIIRVKWIETWGVFSNRDMNKLESETAREYSLKHRQSRFIESSEQIWYRAYKWRELLEALELSFRAIESALDEVPYIMPIFVTREVEYKEPLFLLTIVLKAACSREFTGLYPFLHSACQKKQFRVSPAVTASIEITREGQQTLMENQLDGRLKLFSRLAIATGNNLLDAGSLGNKQEIERASTVVLMLLATSRVSRVRRWDTSWNSQLGQTTIRPDRCGPEVRTSRRAHQQSLRRAPTNSRSDDRTVTISRHNSPMTYHQHTCCRACARRLKHLGYLSRSRTIQRTGPDRRLLRKHFWRGRESLETKERRNVPEVAADWRSTFRQLAPHSESQIRYGGVHEYTRIYPYTTE